MAAATEARDALRDLDYDALAAMVSPDENLAFEPYMSFTDESIRLSPQEIRQLLGRPDTVYTWGSYDGSGEPIELDFFDYWARFVWDRDYGYAPSVTVDDYLAPSQSLSNLAERFGPTAHWVEYYFPEADNSPVFWSALYLVFRETATGYDLIGIVHDEHTV